MRGYAHVVKEDRQQPEHPLSRDRDGAVRFGRRRGALGAVPAEQLPERWRCATSRCQQREDDLVLATHGRGIWVIDDVSPLRSLTPDNAGGRGDADPERAAAAADRGNRRLVGRRRQLLGREPAVGRGDHLLPEARHVIGRMKLEILDSAGQCGRFESRPTKRKGLNRVIWSMRTKPPTVPPAAAIAGRLDPGPADHAGQLHRPADQGGRGHARSRSTCVTDKRSNFIDGRPQGAI